VSIPGPSLGKQRSTMKMIATRTISGSTASRPTNFKSQISNFKSPTPPLPPFPPLKTSCATRLVLGGSSETPKGFASRPPFLGHATPDGKSQITRGGKSQIPGSKSQVNFKSQISDQKSTGTHHSNTPLLQSSPLCYLRYLL
jgi:hypothetical protein